MNNADKVDILIVKVDILIVDDQPQKLLSS